jgi:hypothetical protein
MRERKRNILIRAIHTLPSFRLPDKESWEKIEKRMNERAGEVTLKKTLNEMPTYVLPHDIWPGIEEKLTQKDVNLRKAIDDLPAFKVPYDVWKGIKAKAGWQKKTQIGIFKSPVFRIAASILLLVSLTYLAYRFLMPPKDKTISIHTETINNGDNLFMKPPRVEMQPVFNSQLCKGNPQICNSPQFKELDRQLKELNQKLNAIMKQPGSKNDPQLLKYYYRLENEKAEVEKRMIKLIIQT